MEIKTGLTLILEKLPNGFIQFSRLPVLEQSSLVVIQMVLSHSQEVDNGLKNLITQLEEPGLHGTQLLMSTQK